MDDDILGWRNVLFQMIWRRNNKRNFSKSICSVIKDSHINVTLPQQSHIDFSVYLYELGYGTLLVSELNQMFWEWILKIIQLFFFFSLHSANSNDKWSKVSNSLCWLSIRSFFFLFACSSLLDIVNKFQSWKLTHAIANVINSYVIPSSNSSVVLRQAL